MTLNFIKYIYKHPFNSKNKLNGLFQYFKWQIICRLNEHPIIYPYTENSKLLMWKGLSGADSNFYCGLVEFDDMGFLLHFLRPEDLFVDIGANIGSYTILASGEKKAKSISIEPIPSTFKNLTDNILINQLQDKVTPLNIGLGSSKGTLKFTKHLDSVNHVATEDEKGTVDVKVDTLDSIISDQNPALLKIDVEGFETEVLNGAKKTLNTKELKAVIIELNGSGDRYGYDENKIYQKFIEHGFKAFTYNPILRELKEISTYGNHNTIFIRDEQFVKNRIENSRKIKIGSRQQCI